MASFEYPDECGNLKSLAEKWINNILSKSSLCEYYNGNGTPNKLHIYTPTTLTSDSISKQYSPITNKKIFFFIFGLPYKTNPVQSQ